MSGFNDGYADNLSFVLSPASAETAVLLRDGRLVSDRWEVGFVSRTDRRYTLQRTIDLGTWETVGGSEAGTGGLFMLPDLTPPAERAFYRVRADKP